MASVVDELAAITSALEDALADADRASARAHESWVGDAATAHEAAHERWAADAAVMRDALSKLRTLLSAAGENYDAAGSANSRMWS